MNPQSPNIKQDELEYFKIRCGMRLTCLALQILGFLTILMIYSFLVIIASTDIYRTRRRFGGDVLYIAVHLLYVVVL